jgi:quinol monooxygenase YgiN
MPVELRVEWRVHPQQASAVAEAVQSVVNASRRERGCLNCSFATDLGDPVTLRVREVWDSEASLRCSLQSRRFAILAGLLETAIEPPTFEVIVDGRIRGFDYVDEVRQDGQAVVNGRAATSERMRAGSPGQKSTSKPG